MLKSYYCLCLGGESLLSVYTQSRVERKLLLFVSNLLLFVNEK